MKKKTGPEQAKKTIPQQPVSEKPVVKKAGKGEFPLVVGIGASAGGLEALEQFLSAVKPETGMAFVIVQHLDPDYKGIMPELLQRITTMNVEQVTDRVSLLPDHVYVIPPGRDMSVLHGHLHLLEPKAPRGLRLPIDFFFSSLADDLREKSIGVILSGMGTDGTAGLRAIREKGGLALVQEPGSAKFDGMPRSAIDAGLADIVAPADKLPEKIRGFVRLAPAGGMPDEVLEQASKSSLEKVIILLRAQTGHDFSRYKKNTVYRRIERRMGIHQIDRISTYVRYLQENPAELNFLFRELLIGVTSFFRDPAVWDHLRDEVIPTLIATSPENRTLRAWVAGCSTGEEAYSLAIVFREALERARPKTRLTLQIYATDLDQDAIEKARSAFYPENIVADVSPERLDRFFRKEETGGYRIAKEIREMVIFAPQNLIMDPPFTKLDFLTCRNLFIYLEPEIQKKLLPLFHYALNPGGILVLGTAETINGFTRLFSPEEPKLRIFTRRESLLQGDQIEFPTGFFPPRAAPPAAVSRMEKPVVNLQLLADQLLLERYSPAAIMTTEAGDILYIHGKTGKYLEPAAGKVNWNIFAMAREGLRFELSSAFQQALKKKKAVTVKGVRIQADSITHEADVTVQQITEPAGLHGNVLVIISDVTSVQIPPAPGKKKVVPAVKNTRITELELGLRQSREELQSLRELMQTSQEELKSTNEELQSTNEELQSTNEELTTSKEEMQSLNEELQTVNTELQSRIEDLSSANNDMKNLLNSTDIATVFLDDALNVRRFTSKATSVIRLIPGDVGRPVTDIASDFIYPDLTADCREVLRTLVFSEKVIATSDGRFFSVRIMPYRTLENKIEGIVITFIDMTEHILLEHSLTEARRFSEAIVATVRESLLILDSSMRVVSANRAFLNTFRIPKEEVEGRIMYEIGSGQWDHPGLRRLLETILPESTSFENYRFETSFPLLGHRVMLLNACRIHTETEGQEHILLAIEDVTKTEGQNNETR